MGFFRYRQHEATKNGFNSAFLYNKIAIFVSSKNYTRMEQNWKDKIANLWRKQRLSLRDERDNREKWHMYISPLSLVAGLLALMLVLFIVIISSVAYTPLLEFLPGYQGNRTRTILLENIVRLDSMERRLNQMKVYSDNIALIMEGKTPVMRSLTEQNQSTADKSLVMPSAEDSILRAQIEGDGEYSISSQGNGRRSVRESMQLVSPLAGGVIVNKFSPKSGNLGVSIASTADTQVVTIGDGIVLLNVWSPDYGCLVQVHHPNNMLSIYRTLTQSLVEVGQKVKAGQVIGYNAEATAEGNTPRLLNFEIWNDGKPVDPESYIVF